jgi:hypothetical protein
MQATLWRAATVTLAVALLGAGPAAAPKPEISVPKSDEAAKLAQDLVGRLDTAYFSFARQNAPHFAATFAVKKDGAEAGVLRAAWDALKGELTVTAEASVPEGLREQVEQLAQAGLDEALLSYYSGPGVYAVESPGGFRVSDYSSKIEGLTSQTLTISKDLTRIHVLARFADGSERESVMEGRDAQGRLYLEKLTVLLRAAGRAEQRYEYAFTYAKAGKYPFVRQATLTESAAGVKTTWTFTANEPTFTETVLATPPQPLGGGRPRIVLKEASLGKPPADVVPGSLVVSGDLTRVAVIGKEREKQAVFVNGVKGALYDAVMDLKVSPDGRRFAYRAKRGSDFLVVDDGAEGKAYAGVGPLVFGPDSRLAYQVKMANGMGMVIEGQVGPVYDQISEAYFAPVAGLVVYMTKRSGLRAYVRNGVERRTYALISRPVFSKDGKTFAYGAENVNRKRFVVRDTGASQEEGPAFDYLEEDSIVLSRDGRRVACIGYNGGDDSKYYIADSRQDPVGPFRWATDLILSPDGAHMACAVKEGDEQRYAVHVDGRRAGEVFEETKNPVFSADGRLFYAGKRAGKWLVVAGRDLGRPCERVSRVVLSPDGRRFAYEAELGKDRSVLVLDGVEQPEFVWVGLEDLVWSPDGKHCAYTAGGHGYNSNVLLDGVKKGPYENTSSLRFSPDGSRCTYQFCRDNQWVQVFGEGREGKPCRSLRHPSFSPDGRRLAVIAERDKKLVLLIEDLESEPFEGSVLRDPQWTGPDALRFLVVRKDEVVLVEATIVSE